MLPHAFADVKVDDPAWTVIQWVGLKGLIKGVGKSIGWANKTYFYPDSLMQNREMMDGFSRLYELEGYKETHKTPYISLAQLLKLHQHLKQANTVITDAEDAKLRNMLTNLKPFQLVKKSNQAPLTRKEAAVYLDYLFGSFDKDICLDGTFCAPLK